MSLKTGSSYICQVFCDQWNRSLKLATAATMVGAPINFGRVKKLWDQEGWNRSKLMSIRVVKWDFRKSNKSQMPKSF